MKGTDIMKEVCKEVAKGIAYDVKRLIGDTKTYFWTHPNAIGIAVQGGFIILVTGMLIGGYATEKDFANAYRDGVFKGVRVLNQKPNKEFTFEEGMKYLEYSYRKGIKKKDWKRYLKENGYIN